VLFLVRFAARTRMLLYSPDCMDRKPDLSAREPLNQ
jgi:hypothetical protein